MGRRFLVSFSVLSLLSTLLIAGLYLGVSDWLRRCEVEGEDWLAREGRTAPADPKLIFLAIDRASMLDPDRDVPDLLGPEDVGTAHAEALRLMSRQWPWARSVHALIMDRLFAAGAKVVVFDLLFPTPSPDDDQLRDALAKYRERVVIGSNFADEALHGGERQALVLTRPAKELLGGEGTGDQRVGFVNFWPGEDAVVRDALAVTTQAALYGYPPEPGEETFYSLAAQAVRQMGHPELAPTDGAPRRMRFAGGPRQGFAPHSVYEIFAPQMWKANWQNGAAFRDAVVVIGASGDWLHDEHATPFGTMPGPEIQLNAINTLLHGYFIQGAPRWAGLLGILLAGLLAWGCAILSPPPGWRLLLLALVAAVWWSAALWAFNAANFYLPLTPPLLTLALGGFTGLVHDFTLARGERRRLRSTLERYVSRNLVHELLEKPERFTATLGGVVRPVTVLFSDIRNFTRLCAHTDPRELVDLLNEYLTAMVECAFRHRGTLDKFIGDAVMVVWGNACSDGPAADARQAVACALDMRRELAKLNERWTREGRPTVKIGIALNHGDAVVGNIGSPHRMEFTVMGDAVNVCWRLQERTKFHGSALLVGEALAQLLGDDYECEPLDSVLVGETLNAAYSRLLSAPGWPPPTQPESESTPELCPAGVLEPVG